MSRAWRKANKSEPSLSQHAQLALSTEDRKASDSTGLIDAKIEDFNEQFDRMRERRKLTPITDELNFDVPESTHEEEVTFAERARGSSKELDEEMGGDKRENSPTGEEPGLEDGEVEVDQEINPEMEVGSPTLDRVTEDDVALDMDEWELDPESEDEMSEDSEEDGVGFE